MMTDRSEFIKRYAAKSGLSADYADLGFIDVGGRIIVALPCECGETMCEGWAMISAEHVDHHLLFNAPEKLCQSYREAVENVRPLSSPLRQED